MRPVDEQRIDEVMALVRAELVRAVERFGPMASPHEGWAVIRGKVDDLLDEVKADQHDLAAKEVVRVAAMGARYVFDLVPDDQMLRRHVAARSARNDTHPTRYLILNTGELIALRDNLVEGNGNRELLDAVIAEIATREVAVHWTP